MTPVFPCPSCDQPMIVRRMKNGNIMQQCKSCGVQQFIRSRAGLEAFEKKYPGYAPPREGGAPAKPAKAPATASPSSSGARTPTQAPAEPAKGDGWELP